MGRWILLLPLFLFLRDGSPVARPDNVKVTEAAGKKGDATKDPMEHLRQNDPLAFLEKCLEKSRRVKTYTCLFNKREKVDDKLYDPEKLEVAFRAEPFSVYMNWLAGARPLGAKRVVYVKGENEGNLLALGNVPFLTVIRTVEIHSDEAKKGNRFTVDQFGMHVGMERTIASMKKAQARGALHLRYEGEVQDPRLGDVTCYKFVRKPYVPFEEQNLNELIVFIEKETGLQVGSILNDNRGELIAEYFFRDIRINPELAPNQFSRAMLEK